MRNEMCVITCTRHFPIFKRFLYFNVWILIQLMVVSGWIFHTHKIWFSFVLPISPLKWSYTVSTNMKNASMPILKLRIKCNKSSLWVLYLVENNFANRLWVKIPIAPSLLSRTEFISVLKVVIFIHNG